jgi:hypothetical protein
MVSEALAVLVPVRNPFVWAFRRVRGLASGTPVQRIVGAVEWAVSIGVLYFAAGFGAVIDAAGAAGAALGGTVIFFGAAYLAALLYGLLGGMARAEVGILQRENSELRSRLTVEASDDAEQAALDRFSVLHVTGQFMVRQMDSSDPADIVPEGSKARREAKEWTEQCLALLRVNVSRPEFNLFAYLDYEQDRHTGEPRGLREFRLRVLALGQIVEARTRRRLESGKSLLSVEASQKQWEPFTPFKTDAGST